MQQTIGNAHSVISSMHSVLRVPKNIHSLHRKVTRTFNSCGNKRFVVMVLLTIGVVVILYIILKTRETLFSSRRTTNTPEAQKSWADLLRSGMNNFTKHMSDESDATQVSSPHYVAFNDVNIVLQDRTKSGEEKVRAVTEHLMAAAFPSTRPSWLRNPKTNRTLQLDCYNKALGLAVEFDGLRKRHIFLCHKQPNVFPQ
jgi:hypothetical protein